MKDKIINIIEKSFDREDLFLSDIPEKYHYDESTIYKAEPEAVFLPDCAEKIIDFIKIANESNIKIIPRGAGTGVCGGAVATYGGVILSLERMDKILDIDETNLTATVYGGLINGFLKEELKKIGYYYPPDPQSFETSTIGGNIATNAGGPSAIKYGTTKDYVMSLSVITGEGIQLNTGGKVYKCSSGYNLNELFIGSEGTLGIILTATLNFIRLPEKKVFFLVPFQNVLDVMTFFRESIKSHINFSALEFIDESAKRLVEIFLKRKLPKSDIASCYLFIEYEGDIDENKIFELIEKSKGLELFYAKDKNQEERLWEARRKIAYAVKDYAKKVYKADVVVPRGSIPIFLEKLRKFESDDLIIATFGHIGDGNIHLNILDRDGDKPNESYELMRKVMAIVNELKGFPSGEHGIGLAKKEFLKNFFSVYHIDRWKAIKRVFDPKNIMNPGKIFD